MNPAVPASTRLTAPRISQTLTFVHSILVRRHSQFALLVAIAHNSLDCECCAKHAAHPRQECSERLYAHSSPLCLPPNHSTHIHWKCPGGIIDCPSTRYIWFHLSTTALGSRIE